MLASSSSSSRQLSLTVAALVAFAANSLLCRAALADGDADAATFTCLRLASGAVMLQLIVWLRRALSTDRTRRTAGDWRSAAALTAYAACFSFAYLWLNAGVGALLLFGAVQVTMILTGLRSGERLTGRRWLGLLLAGMGLTVLVWPSASSWILEDGLRSGRSLAGCVLMALSGASWGAYSLWGRSGGDPTETTAGNFLRAAPLGALILLAGWRQASVSPAGATLAVISGALTSGVGYVLWYAALKGLSATRAATLQLSVPIIAAAGGVVFLGEQVTATLIAASILVLTGVVLGRK